MDVYPLEGDLFTFQKLYLGVSALKELNLCPGCSVRLQLRQGSVLQTVVAKVWLHSLPSVDHADLQGGVVEGKGELLHVYSQVRDTQAACRYLDSVSVIEVEEVSDVGVEVVLEGRGVRTHGLEDLVSRLLRDMTLTPGCFVSLTKETRRLHKVRGVRLVSREGQKEAFTVSNKCQVRLVRVVSAERLDLLLEGLRTPKIAGVSEIYESLRQIIEGGSGSVLLSGPSGCGKSTLVARVGRDLNLPLIKVNCSTLARPNPGETEAALREVFSRGADLAREGGGLLELEEVECAGSRRGKGQGAHLARVVSQLQALLDRRVEGLAVVASTTRPEELDTALRRPGRLGGELVIRTPDLGDRKQMLGCLLDRCGLELREDEVSQLAGQTPGYVASDLALLVSRLARVERPVSWEQVESEVCRTKPAVFRSGLGAVTLQKVSWDSIGGLDEVKSKLRRAVELPLTNPSAFTRLGIRPSKGVLLSGPPGCGKTRLVRAVASNCQATFLAVSAAEIFSPFVGDSERAVVELFTKARMGAPAVLFIDEIDALVASRDMGGSQSSSDRVLAALLTEMDGLGGEGGRVVVVGATNRPDTLDPALTRPGRLDTLLHVPPPDPAGRRDILSTLLTRVPHGDLDLERVADRTRGFSGADLESLVREAVLEQLSKDFSADKLCQESLEMMVDKVGPSLDRTFITSR